MTYAPARLLEVRRYLQPITGLSNAELGITPDAEHDGGYHCGWDQRRIVNGQLDDYAWEESPRDWSHKTNAARAFDLGLFARLQAFSVWLVGQCAAGAPDTLDIREVIYSPDGVVVKRWDRLGRRTSGDSSHRTHTHISWFADAEDRDKVSVFKRFFGDDMEQSETLRSRTNFAQRNVGDALADVSNLRDAMIGSGVAYPPDPTGYPVPGSPLWNIQHLPELVAEKLTPEQLAEIGVKAGEHAAALIGGKLDALFAALPKPPTAAEIATAVADEDHRRSAS